MAAAFDRDQLLDAFDEIGEAAVAADTRLDIAVFGGSALMLASNFRFRRRMSTLPKSVGRGRMAVRFGGRIAE